MPSHMAGIKYKLNYTHEIGLSPVILFFLYQKLCSRVNCTFFKVPCIKLIYNWFETLKNG